MVKDILIQALENAGFEVFNQNAIPSDTPQSYVTFYVNGSYDVAYFDNDRHLTAWSIEVKFFCDDPITLENAKYTIRNTLKDVGFTTNGIGWDILISNENNKLGWDCDFDYIETVTEWS